MPSTRLQDAKAKYPKRSCYHITQSFEMEAHCEFLRKSKRFIDDRRRSASFSQQ